MPGPEGHACATTWLLHIFSCPCAHATCALLPRPPQVIVLAAGTVSGQECSVWQEVGTMHVHDTRPAQYSGRMPSFQFVLVRVQVPQTHPAPNLPRMSNEPSKLAAAATTPHHANHQQPPWFSCRTTSGRSRWAATSSWREPLRLSWPPSMPGWTSGRRTFAR